MQEIYNVRNVQNCNFVQRNVTKTEKSTRGAQTSVNAITFFEVFTRQQYTHRRFALPSNWQKII